jgi:hypothetical protein
LTELSQKLLFYLYQSKLKGGARFLTCTVHVARIVVLVVEVPLEVGNIVVVVVVVVVYVVILSGGSPS